MKGCWRDWGDMGREPWLKSGMAAIVTGASSGIGKCIASRLASEGVCVAAFSRTASKNEVSGVNGEVLSIECDVRDNESVRKAVEAAYDRFGRLDILVNAAGVSMPEFKDISSIDPDLWRCIVETNLNGLFFVTRCAMPHLKKSGGYVVNILSTAAFRSVSGNVPYSASKHGARAVSETIALEGKEAGVRVASISPGPVNTNIWTHKNIPPDAEKRARMLDPEDIGDIAMFLFKSPEYVVVDNITVTPLHY